MSSLSDISLKFNDICEMSTSMIMVKKPCMIVCEMSSMLILLSASILLTAAIDSYSVLPDYCRYGFHAPPPANTLAFVKTL